MSDTTFVVCETIAAITTHLRIVTAEHPIRLSGHWPRPLTLCRMEAGWDTQIPVRRRDGTIAARCRHCLAELAMMDAA
jgi:hypothetical protein